MLQINSEQTLTFYTFVLLSSPPHQVNRVSEREVSVLTQIPSGTLVCSWIPVFRFSEAPYSTPRALGAIQTGVKH